MPKRADGEDGRMNDLSHIAEDGSSKMVNVGDKAVTRRRAVTQAVVQARAETVALIRGGKVEKGNVFEVARVAAIQAAKRTAETIPMCHPIALTGIDVQFEVTGDTSITITATVEAHDRTGVEMEALYAAAVAALTIYDMCKAVDRGMTVTDIQLQEKSGGRSGRWVRS